MTGLLQQSTSQHIERSLRRTPANEVSIARQLEPAMLGLNIIRKRNENRPDRFLFSTSARSRNSGDRQPEVSPNTRANTLRHRLRYRRTHRAVLHQQHRLDAKRFRLHLIRVGYDAANEILRRPRYV